MFVLKILNEVIGNKLLLLAPLLSHPRPSLTSLNHVVEPFHPIILAGILKRHLSRKAPRTGTR
jgi:hypothetical protein